MDNFLEQLAVDVANSAAAAARQNSSADVASDASSDDRKPAAKVRRYESPQEESSEEEEEVWEEHAFLLLPQAASASVSASTAAELPTPHLDKSSSDRSTFHYVDHSKEPDSKPLSPLTPPGRVPNFTAKLHAILSRSEFEGILRWCIHGRAFTIHDAKEVERKVLPRYFDFTQFSAFASHLSQWGFRQSSAEKCCYYHPRFLRGLPHLCKKLKRPRVTTMHTQQQEQQQQQQPYNEPNFTQMERLPELTNPGNNDTIARLEQCLRGGPNARMPIYSGMTMLLPKPSTKPFANSAYRQQESLTSLFTTPRDEEALYSFQRALGIPAMQEHYRHKYETLTHPRGGRSSNSGNGNAPTLKKMNAALFAANQMAFSKTTNASNKRDSSALSVTNGLALSAPGIAATTNHNSGVSSKTTDAASSTLAAAHSLAFAQHHPTMSSSSSTSHAATILSVANDLAYRSARRSGSGVGGTTSRSISTSRQLADQMNLVVPTQPSTPAAAKASTAQVATS